MTEAKRPLKVFLCHAHSDKDAVKALYTHLTTDGVDAWLDKEKLLPGQDWELEIRKAVREADVVVVCLSKQFNQAGFRQKEVRLALDTAMEKPEGEIFIIPARLEECDNLESLKKWHWVDLFEEDGYEMLMRALRARASKIGATLQLRKSWLPKIASANTNIQKSANQKKTTKPDEIVAEKIVANEKIERENAVTAAKEKEKKETAKKAAQEKLEKEIRREYERMMKKARRDLWWGKFKRNIRYRLDLIRIYRVPILILLVTFAIVTPLIIDLSNRIPELIQTLTATPSTTNNPSTKTPDIVELTNTPLIIPSSTLTEIFTPTATPLTTEITDDKGVSMVLVPAGEFIMGSDSGNTYDRPAHKVYLDSFYIDKYEVSNTLYKACVNAGKCQPPTISSSSTHSSYYSNTDFDNYPVIHVNWYMAKTYCEWREGRLPTEAEWEKAARGTDGLLYPWGENFDCTFANVQSCVSDTTSVGSYENGGSPYGVFDMVGNVWEWVSSLYAPYPYNSKDGRENLNASGNRVIRGGAFHNDSSFANSVRRYYDLEPTATEKIDVGFRCARDANP